MEMKQSSMLINFFLVAAIIQMTTAYDNHEVLEQTNYIIQQQSQFQMNNKSPYLSIPLHLNTIQNSQQFNIQENEFAKTEDLDLTHQNIQNSQIAFELTINSPYEYKVYLHTTNAHNSTSLRLFKNIQGYHYLKFNNIQQYKLEIIVEGIDIEENSEDDDENYNNQDQENESNFNERVQENNGIKQSYQLKIIKLDKSQQYCPFSCHKNGVCNENSVCECSNGFSQQFNCLIKAQTLSVQIDEIKSISTDLTLIENSEETQDAMKSSNDYLDIEKEERYQINKWNYGIIDLKDIEEVKDLLHNRQQFNNDISEILVTFYYEKEATNDFIIAILDSHNYFKPLDTEEDIGDNEYMSTYSISSKDYYKFFIDSAQSSQLIVFSYNQNLKNLEIEVQIKVSIYDDFKLFYESLQLFVVITSTILLFIFLVITFRNNVKFDQNNDQSILKRNLHLSKLEIQNRIKSQIQSYKYHQCSQLPQVYNGTYTECFICISNYEESEELSKTKCGHVFHKTCLDAWLQKNQVCPIDRAYLLDDVESIKQEKD